MLCYFKHDNVSVCEASGDRLGAGIQGCGSCDIWGSSEVNYTRGAILT